jgi:hypothetical protein
VLRAWIQYPSLDFGTSVLGIDSHSVVGKCWNWDYSLESYIFVAIPKFPVGDTRDTNRDYDVGGTDLAVIAAQIH